jgi:hypothetical protein
MSLHCTQLITNALHTLIILLKIFGTDHKENIVPLLLYPLLPAQPSAWTSQPRQLSSLSIDALPLASNSCCLVVCFAVFP